MDREFRERFDRHNEHMDRHLERIDREIRLTRELYAEYMQESREARRGYRMMISQLFRVVEENSEAIRENREATRDLREASQAHTKGLSRKELCSPGRT